MYVAICKPKEDSHNSFTILKNLQPSFVSIFFYKKRAVKNFNNIIIKWQQPLNL